MSNISVVTVTLNNADGLIATLDSLGKLENLPAIIIIQDGGSTDETGDVMERYRNILPIRYVVETDSGIYDAMNRARRWVKTDFIHYLNAGDTVFGEPYLDISEPCRMAVCRGHFPPDFRLGVFGLSYCHQGIFFPACHDRYNIDYDIAADFDLMLKSFSRGASSLPTIFGGGVIYDIDGVSSVRRLRRDAQIFLILFQRRLYILSILFLLSAALRWPLSKKARERIRKIWYRLNR